MAVTPLKIKFGKLLREYLRAAGIRQNILAERLGISGSAISQMMHGKIVLNQAQLDIITEMLKLNRAQAYELTSMLTRIRNGVETMLSPFNQALFSLRCERGLSIRQLSNLSGVPASHLEVFEKCFDAIPTLDEAKQLAPILGCTPTALLQCAGVGGISASAIDALTRDENGLSADSEVAETGTYKPEKQIPVLSLSELEAYSAEQSIIDYGHSHAIRVMDLSECDFGDTPMVMISALGKELSIGLPGTVELLVAAERPVGYREFNLCCDENGKYSLQEIMTRGRRKEFRTTGTRRSANKLAWELPVLELKIRPTKPEGGRSRE